jgi:hypothetical protein
MSRIRAPKTEGVTFICDIGQKATYLGPQMELAATPAIQSTARKVLQKTGIALIAPRSGGVRSTACTAARAPYLNSAIPPRRCFSSAPIDPLAKQVYKMSLTQHMELPNGVKYDQPLGL